MDDFLHLVACALLVVFVAEFTRALPWPEAWKQRKPLSCNACMTGWALIALGAWQGPSLYLLAVGGLALLMLKWLGSLGEVMGPPLS